MKTNRQMTIIERIRLALTPDEKFIRRGDCVETMHGEIRVLESYLWDLLKEHEQAVALLRKYANDDLAMGTWLASEFIRKHDGITVDNRKGNL